MHDQQVIDAYHPDLRRTRAASQSIIPVDTKLAAGITRIFPQFNDRFEAADPDDKRQSPAGHASPSEWW